MMELSPAISNYIQKKVSPLEKYLPQRAGAKYKREDVVARVEVGKSTEHHKGGNIFRAEVHITGSGLDLYAVAKEEDLYAAIDTVKDEITRNVLQEKGRKLTLARKGAKIMKDAMKGLSTHALRGLSWSAKRLKFRNLREKE